MDAWHVRQTQRSKDLQEQYDGRTRQRKIQLKTRVELYIQFIPTPNTGLCGHNPQAGSF